MSVSYKKLWILLIEKDISPVILRRDLNIATGTMTKLRKNEEVALSVLLRICEYLDCNIGDICDAIKEENESRREWMLNRFEYAGRNDKKTKNYKFWQEGNDEQLIYLDDYLKQKLNYIHLNPVRAELVDEPHHYLYSSAKNYSGEKGLLEVILV